MKLYEAGPLEEGGYTVDVSAGVRLFNHQCNAMKMKQNGGGRGCNIYFNIPQLKSLSPPGEFKRRCDSCRFDEFPIGASRLHRRLAHRPGGKVTKMMRSMMTTMMMRTTMITTMMMTTMITMMSSELNEEASLCLEPQ